MITRFILKASEDLSYLLNNSLSSVQKVIRHFETSKAKLEAQVVQLSRQLQKEIKSNSILTQDGLV